MGGWGRRHCLRASTIYLHEFCGYQLSLISRIQTLAPEREVSDPGWSAFLQEGGDELLLFLPGGGGALGHRERPHEPLDEPLDASHKRAPREFRVLKRRVLAEGGRRSEGRNGRAAVALFRSGGESLGHGVGEMPSSLVAAKAGLPCLCGSGGPRRGRERRGRGG